MKIITGFVATTAALLFILYGASKFYAFMPVPPVRPEASLFISAVVATGYLWRFVGLIEIAGGIMLLFPRTRLAGALLLLPIIANIVPYLWLLARNPPGYVMGAFLLTTEAVILWGARERLRSVFA